MPRYFFDTDDGDRVYRDGRGTELPGAHAAIREARTLAFDLFYGAPAVGRTIMACIVKDEAGIVVYRLMMDVAGEARTVESRADPPIPHLGAPAV